MINSGMFKNPSQKQLRSFSAITFLGSLLIAAAAWRKQSQTPAIVMVCLAGLILLSQFYRPLLLLLYRGWMAFGEILGWFSSRLILIFIFYLVFTPIGLLLRILGKSLLDLRFPDSKPSFWQKRSKPRSNLEKMF